MESLPRMPRWTVTCRMQLRLLLFTCGWILATVHCQEFTYHTSPAPPEYCPDLTLPCSPGEQFGDPEDCSRYYLCTPEGALQPQQCESGKKYHYKKAVCRRRNVKCLDCTGNGALEKVNGDTDYNDLDVDLAQEDKQGNAPGKENGGHLVNNSPTLESVTQGFFLEDNELVTSSSSRRGSDRSVEVVDHLLGSGEGDAKLEDQSTIDTKLDELMTLLPEPISTGKMTTVETPGKATTTGTTESTMAPISPTRKGLVVVPDQPNVTDPPYVIITEGAISTNDSFVAPHPSDPPLDMSKIGLIAGVAAGGLLIIVIVIIAVVCFIKKRKSRKENFIQIENPQYSRPPNKEPHAYRFSRDASLFVEDPRARSNGQQNNNVEKNGFKRSEPKYGEKRRAPPPPNPFTGVIDEDDDYGAPIRQDSTDLYEMDSETSENMEMTTFVPPTKLPHEYDEDEEEAPVNTREINASDPLLNGDEENHVDSPTTRDQHRSTDYSTSSSSDDSSSEEEPTEREPPKRFSSLLGSTPGSGMRDPVAKYELADDKASNPFFDS